MTAQTEPLPTGTVTFFFSDVQDSTGLLQRMASGYKDVLEQHATIIRECLSSNAGIEISTEGDSFFAVFRQTDQAVGAATEIQQKLAAEPWPPGGTVAVRIGLHTGTGELGHDNYVGIDVNRAARISGAGHGGQVVVSETVKALAAAADYLDLGLHSLKGLEKAEHLYQLDVAGLPQSFPPLRSTNARPNNLPTLASRIIGRHAEESQLQDLIAANRLVTLTGPGGIGKTRLALEVANDVLSNFELGVYFVDLAPIDDPGLLATTIASTVGVDRSANDDLAKALSDGDRLLVLDNLEQLVAGAPQLAALIATAKPLKVLVTSQVPLRVAGEVVMRLEPLTVTDAQSPAVELFEARALQADPSFDIDQNWEDVVQLVTLLDGVPLAIELAAARMNVLNPSEVAERIGDGVLKSSRADSPERHRSIAAAIEWSYELLTTGQQEVLQSVSVFHGGATLPALEAVMAQEPLDELAELVDRSLLSTSAGAVGKRFEMLASVQQFAASQLAHPDATAARHADYFFQLAMDAHEPLDGDMRAQWIAKLTDDHDNLRATLDYLLTHGDQGRAYDLLGSIWRYFQSTGKLDELELWLGRVFMADPTSQPTIERARALVARAALYYWRADWQRASDDYDEASAIADQANDRKLLGEIWAGITSTRGAALGTGRDIGSPLESAERVREIAIELDDPAGQAFVEFLMTAVVIMQHPDPASLPEDLFDRVIEFHTQAGSLMNVAHTQIMSAEVDIALGRYELANQNALESIGTTEQAGDIFAMAWALQRYAITVVELGDPIFGARLAGASSASLQRTGGAFPPPFIPIDPPEVRARAIVGEDADHAFEEGKELGLLEAVTLARDHHVSR